MPAEHPGLPFLPVRPIAAGRAVRSGYKFVYNGMKKAPPMIGRGL